MAQLPRLGVHLRRGAHRSDLIEQALAAGVGDRVGLPGVLDDLTRQAMRAQVPGTQVEWGFRWADDDYASKQWWPQGITTSADADPIERVHGQRLILTSWYAQGSDGKNAGSRISVIDLETLRYRHLLLVTPKHSPGGAVLEPLHVHAGGIVWFGGHLHVAGTKQGIFSARLDDIIKVRDPASMQGYRYVLPIESYLDSLLDEEGAGEVLRYSFLSLNRGADTSRLIAGEYGRGAMTTRLVQFPLDPATDHLTLDDTGTAWPLALTPRGLGHMQGATVVGDDYFITTSAGRWRLGSLHVGQPGELRQIPHAIPVGPEDITYWPSDDLLWSLSEYPTRRFVFAVRRGRLLGA